MNDSFRMGFLQGRAHDDQERERMAILNKLPAPNPPELLVPTRCKVLRAFYLAGGKPAAIGDVVTLQKHDAESLAAIGKLEIL
jgi:hypothetical protein